MVPDGTGVASLVEWMFTAVLVHGCVLGAQSTHCVQMLSSKCLSLVRLHANILLGQVAVHSRCLRNGQVCRFGGARDS